ncbi:MAG TPA: CGNR zinc finger domain-containing protein [Gaiellaceae bacterium]|nr:CGNR zinc finger domain-containing protein [Gaiellaceae bacterium]
MVTQELIADFINTLHEDEEALATEADLVAWVTGHGLAEAPLRATAGELDDAHAAREALRAFLLANNEVDVDLTTPTLVLDGIAQRARVELRFVDGAPVLAPAEAGVLGALGQILAAVQAMTLDGSWSRLKVCRAHDCKWAFVDNAKNQSRAWCSMRSCGNREKARVFRERRKSAELS